MEDEGLDSHDLLQIAAAATAASPKKRCGKGVKDVQDEHG